MVFGYLVVRTLVDVADCGVTMLEGADRGPTAPPARTAATRKLTGTPFASGRRMTGASCAVYTAPVDAVMRYPVTSSPSSGGVQTSLTEAGLAMASPPWEVAALLTPRAR